MEGDPHFLCERFCLAKRPSLASGSIFMGFFRVESIGALNFLCFCGWIRLTYLDGFASVSTTFLVCNTEQLGMIGHSK